MNVEYLIQLLNNKLIVLNNAKILAYNNGDLPTINALEEEILGVNNTLSQLKLLQTIDVAAVSANVTPTEVITSGIEAVKNLVIEGPSIQGPSASAIINGYDISAYATDALHEQKIQTIINAMPSVVTEEDIDNYIQDKALGSFVAGYMVVKAATEYSVDIPLLLAIMQNDSQFGMVGIGARTNNPGNVGNDGINERVYPSWEEGVLAVAEWLDRHRVVPLTKTIEEVSKVEPDKVVAQKKRSRKVA